MNSLELKKMSLFQWKVHFINQITFEVIDFTTSSKRQKFSSIFSQCARGSDPKKWKILLTNNICVSLLISLMSLLFIRILFIQLCFLFVFTTVFDPTKNFSLFFMPPRHFNSDSFHVWRDGGHKIIVILQRHCDVDYGGNLGNSDVNCKDNSINKCENTASRTLHLVRLEKENRGKNNRKQRRYPFGSY